MRGPIHHLDLTVREPRASLGFYDALLGFMGYRRVREDARGFDWELRAAGGGFAFDRRDAGLGKRARAHA